MILKGKAMIAHGQSLKQALHRALLALDLRGKEIVTIFKGQEASDDGVAILESVFKNVMGNPQIDVQEGGQPHYPYLLMIE